MLTLSDTLKYYKRRDVQQLLLEQATNKEIGTRFNDSFGKRPDILTYENDILEMAKRGATSFHCSEELWDNPLQLNANLKRSELDELRTGWDLILDIDCPFWPLAKCITYLFIKALKDHNIEAVTVKFSGGKGFHIAVPFETFPKKIRRFDEQTKKIQEVQTKDLFPEGPRKIAEYLLHYMSTQLLVIDYDKKIIHFAKTAMTFEQFMKITGKNEEETLIRHCKKCSKIIKEKRVVIEYICPKCEHSLKDVEIPMMQCPKCRRIMEKHHGKQTLCDCGSNDTITKLDLRTIVEVDTVLISSRHMYRMAYSLHEKSGLVSMPFDIKHILKFEKNEASQEQFKPYKFLNRSEAKPGEATVLFEKSFEFYASKETNKDAENRLKKEKQTMQSQDIMLDNVAIAVPEECFPPCVKKILAGVEDGKKRALFILINFLQSCNWEYEKMEEFILQWNTKNPESLRETYIRGQLRYAKMQKDKSPPPNCDNKAYYQDLQICAPDSLCAKIKNPLQYAKRRAFLQANAPKAKPVKETKEVVHKEKKEHKSKEEKIEKKT